MINNYSNSGLLSYIAIPHDSKVTQ